MPPIEHIKTAELDFSILNHELIHFTVNTKRLNRFRGNEVSTFGSIFCSAEELVAEIGPTFLNNHCGILNDETFTDSSSYIQ